MPPRQSPSNQNQSGKPKAQSPLVPNDSDSSSQQLSLPGLGPDPNPKVQVRNVNPPITPDQVVSQAEAPTVSLPDLPKIQNIKIPAVKNKTIQGHLKAIEAKMTATEKLMKDIVKLQRVQIHTEKELHERRRELYQNTLEEYLYDKTIDFKSPQNPDCTCINLPKKPGDSGPPIVLPPKPPGTPPTGGAPVTNPVPDPSPVDDGAEDPIGDTVPGGNDIPDFDPPILPPEKEDEQYRRPGVLDFLQLIPFLFQDLLRNQPLGTAKQTEDFLAGEPGTPSYSPSPTYADTIASFYNPANQPSLFESIPGSNSFAELIGQDPKMMSDSFDIATMFLGPGFGTQVPKIVTNPAVLSMASKSPNIARFLGISPAAATSTGSATIAKQRLLNDPMRGIVPQRPTFRGVPDAQRIQTAQMIRAASSRGPLGGYTDPMSRGSVDNIFKQSLLQEGLDFSNYKPLTDVVDTSRFYSNMGISDDALRMLFSDSDAAKALNYFDDIPANDLAIRSEFDSFSTPQGQAAMRDALRDSGSILDDIRPSDAERAFGTSRANISPELDGITSITNKASGGMGSMDLHNSKAKQYFRKVSNDMNIPKFGGGGFNLLNPMSWFRGDLKRAQEGELENVSNDTFAGKLYNRRKQQEEMMKKLRGYQSGGLVGWWNKGRNVRVPNENSARWRGPDGLLADDAKQITRTDKAFKSGAGGVKGWRPLKAFTPEMVRTGPTPAVRQAFERPVRTATHPLIMALEFIVNDLLINPRSTAAYDQVTGPNAYYNAPGYKGPMPSQNLENAQNSMMSGSDNQQPQVMPLPPDYIKIPGKTPSKQMDTFVVPGIDKPSSMFTRSTTFIE